MSYVNHSTSIRRKIVCLCGSTKFNEAFEKASYDLALKGDIVLSVGCFRNYKNEFQVTPDEKIALDKLHFDKIDLADEVLFLNVNGYIGESTKKELAYSIFKCKSIEFLDNKLGEEYMESNSRMLGHMAAMFLVKGLK
jgi:hypothetical protein